MERISWKDKITNKEERHEDEMKKKEERRDEKKDVTGKNKTGKLIVKILK